MQKSTTTNADDYNPWLQAWYDPVACLQASSSCIALADVYADGDYKLIIADADRRLKLYKGQSLLNEQAILGVPVALCAYYSDTTQPRIPSVAVASGCYIFIYRNMRPYYKFTVPAIELSKEEGEIWDSLSKCSIEIPEAIQQLNTARENNLTLSTRSLGLLAIDDIEQQADYVTRLMDEPFVQQTCITTMCSIKKSMDDKDSVSCLVIATESKIVYILNPQAQSVKTQVKIPGIAVSMSVIGLLDVEYRIIIACRNGSVYTIKNGEILRNTIELESPACALIAMEKSIVVACMDKKIHSFHLKGKKGWSITMPDNITALELLNLKRTKHSKGFLIALKSGHIHLFNEKFKICKVPTEGHITGMRFGIFGREEGCLIVLHKSGSITVKILQRNAKLEAPNTGAGPPPEQDVPLNIPKKTKLYVEQTQRERDQAIEMHRIFQRDLCKLRLTTARSYVKIIQEGQGPVSYSSGSSIRLNAQVQGIGPFFKVKLNLQNSGKNSAMDIPVALHFNHDLYRLKQGLFTIPLLIPGVQYRYDVDVESISEEGTADSIYIFVCGKDSCVPIVSAVVAMPISEPLLET